MYKLNARKSSHHKDDGKGKEKEREKDEENDKDNKIMR